MDSKRIATRANRPSARVSRDTDPVPPLPLKRKESTPDTPKYHVDGVAYDTYHEMVQAKRQRNQQVLQDSGLLGAFRAVAARPVVVRAPRVVTPRTDAPRRQSSRLQGIPASDVVTANEGVADDGTDETASSGNRRLYDGSSWTMAQALESSAQYSWMHRPDNVDDVAFTKAFVRSTLLHSVDRSRDDDDIVSNHSSVDAVSFDTLTVDDPTRNVAKVCPERIYSMAVHPSRDNVIVCAGDKHGHVGVWNVHTAVTAAEPPRVHLFRPHQSVVCHLQWTVQGDALLSASYDGTVRWWDVHAEQWDELLDTKCISEWNDMTGWTQYACLDPRNEQCLFLATSVGTALHVDLRSNKKRLTFHQELSAKKINTLSLHPNGHSLISAGLDGTVALWDVRQLGRTTPKGAAPLDPVASYHVGKSVNAAFWSATGRYMVSTTMADTLDVWTDFHLSTSEPIAPTQRIAHNNQTGRWLTTFHAICHPQLDVYSVGSMHRPRRRLDLLNLTKGAAQLHSVSGDALTAVVSRCAFHPRSDRLIVAGGNSSGRVTLFM